MQIAGDRLGERVITDLGNLVDDVVELLRITRRLVTDEVGRQSLAERPFGGWRNDAARRVGGSRVDHPCTTPAEGGEVLLDRHAVERDCSLDVLDRDRHVASLHSNTQHEHVHAAAVAEQRGREPLSINTDSTL